jgi:anti-sigma-K factor RskA
MNPGIDESTNSSNETFDRDMRQLHGSAVVNISPQTLARLRGARHGAQAAPPRGNAWRWAAASALPAVLAVAIGMRFLAPPAPTPVAQPMATTTSNSGYVDSVATLDENPDLYLWLASSEAEPLAME